MILLTGIWKPPLFEGAVILILDGFSTVILVMFFIWTMVSSRIVKSSSSVIYVCGIYDINVSCFFKTLVTAVVKVYDCLAAVRYDEFFLGITWPSFGVIFKLFLCYLYTA